MRKIIIIILFLILKIYSINATDFLNIKITKFKPRDDYKLKLIKLFLNKSGEKYKISFLNFEVTKPREFLEIKKGKMLNVGMFTSSYKHEKYLIPIRYPIYGGLIGYRIFFINKSKRNLFKKINSVNELKKLVCGQGLLWTDTEILKNAGFNVYETKYMNIFAMLNANHGIDFFPRGIYEIFFEMDHYHNKYPNLIIEENLMLHYPLAMFLFVSPKTPKIAKALKKGFKIALEDGSLFKLRNSKIIGKYTINEIIKKTNFKNRIIFEIPNPYLPEETKQLPSNFWIKIKEINKK